MTPDVSRFYQVLSDAERALSKQLSKQEGLVKSIEEQLAVEGQVFRAKLPFHALLVSATPCLGLICGILVLSVVPLRRCVEPSQTEAQGSDRTLGH
jgi:hypothetical protein